LNSRIYVRLTESLFLFFIGTHLFIRVLATNEIPKNYYDGIRIFNQTVDYITQKNGNSSTTNEILKTLRNSKLNLPYLLIWLLMI